MKSDRSKVRRPVIGVTGAIGSGKSTVAGLFGQCGAAVISGDRIGHHVVDRSRTLRRQLAGAFGEDIIQGGHIDRRLLAERAFSSPAKLRVLNGLVHPPLIRELNRQIRVALKTHGVHAVVIDAALLVEWGMGKIDWDVLVGVDAPHKLRLKRLRQRGLTLSEIRRFSGAQMPWKRKRQHCDFVVKNDTTLAILRRRTRLCWDKVLSFNRV